MLTPPSPSSSPVNDTSSRKRQRSPSMHSEADSSSPKRAASQDLVLENSSSPREHPAKADYNADEDIDTYMAEQGEANIPLTLDLSTPPPPPVTNLTPMTKLESIDSLRKKPMQPGEMWYLVARPWYKRWRLACSGEEDKEGRVNEADLGPVDNSSLVDASGNLISSATEGVDVEFVPEQAWNLLVQWYGEPPYTLQRKVITRGMFNEASLELYPPRFKIHLLSPQPIDNDLEESIPLTMSSKDTLSDLHKHILLAVPKSDGGERRVWRLTEGGNWTRLHYPATRLKEDGASLLEDNRKYLEEGMIESGDTFVVEEAGPDGKWLIDGLPRSTAVSGTTTPLSTADSSTRLFGTSDFFSNLQAKATIAGNETKVEKKALTLKPPVTIKVGPSSNIRSKGPKIIPGTLGLGNMGNTCFMNSAIQCLAHTEELTEFFLTGVFEDELNPENPLGMRGAIAEAFGALLRRIWDTNSSMSSYSPREFKSVLQRFAPQFAGYQQHDSQELVAFLLDGLHEDLNRILKKPYVEKPDWEGGGDKEMVALAKESWDGYMKRNDSVIVDLFQGQYKSTLVCPECQKVSITFDPFMYLTLPLPVQKKFTHDIYYVPWDHSKSHVKVPIEMSRDSSFRDVRQQLARWMNSDADLLLTLEIFNHRFFKDLDDHVSWGDVQDNDIIVCFELPCHARQSRNYKKQEGDPFILPVFMCDTIQSISRTSSYNNTISYFGYPFFVVLDEKQATDPDAMYDAIIERLERWSANVRDLYKWEAGPSDASMEEVPIPITSAPAPTTETVTEIKVNGDVVNVEEPIPEEGDIVDEKSIVIQEDASMSDTEPDDSEIPRRVGTKKGIYNLRLHGPVYGGSNYGGLYNISSRGLVDWEMRKNRARADEKPILLRHGDSLFIEFDVNMKSYYFGDDRSAKWSHWEEFIHPDLAASRKSAEARKDKKITLQDCLDEFTREETLGQDDLWYCPRCKKHQQATKRFDLWKTPDVLVVHLKRFSNSRLLRDKIDAFVDFPVQGLDLTDMIGEREVAKRLLSENVNVEELGLTDLDEPLVYDLYAVDEHLGGLGGGHYRAYAHNHLNDKWYHFDDSYVSEANADKAVSSNAYLLFYKRRTSRPLGGKSHLKIEEARNKPKPSTPTPEVKIEDSQLPTPPAESPPNSYTDAEPDIDATDSSFMTPYSDGISSPGSSPPPLEYIPAVA
ncbi:unnamed protein product [Somion occarium]|uniref:ubiquitinyl hydrolase 1 n=1 Tax=Somion occarium TaxID=3059160 RepID=A0ABP1E4P9_9APHY